MANSDINNCSSSLSFNCDKSKQSNKTKQQTNVSCLGIVNRSRQRWQLLSKAVRMKQFDLQELQSIKNFVVENDDRNSTSPDSISSENSSKNLLNEQIIDRRNCLQSLIETYGLIDYHYGYCENGSYNNNDVWIECQWNKQLNNNFDIFNNDDNDNNNNNNGANFNINGDNIDNNNKLYIKLVNNRLQLKDLAGFDNSGNVRIWSSEEALAYLLAHNKNIRSRLKGRILCELGSGCSALAGLIAAQSGLATEIYLTDGNERCVNNIKQIVQKNFSDINKSTATTLKIIVQQLCWNQSEQNKGLKNHIETIICADCLFCSDSHQSLIDIIDFLLVNNNIGQALIVAPRRGDKLDRFIRRVFDDGRFFLQLYYDYDHQFTKHFERLRQQDPQRYDPDTTYPYLLIMNRRHLTTTNLINHQH